jgi:hypothetical protein
MAAFGMDINAAGENFLKLGRLIGRQKFLETSNEM